LTPVAREHWKNRIGFIWAAVGSAVGLGNIWRFPYVLGANGGAAFLFVYLICLLLVGFPVLISEILMGRKAQTSPSGAFALLGGGKRWSLIGKGTILTGFFVSAFYSVVAGWTMGYLIEALRGNLTGFTSAVEAKETFSNFIANPYWSLGFHAAFLLIATLIVHTGVKKGIESGNKIMMPLLFIVLVGLVMKGVTLPGSDAGVRFIFYPDWSQINGKTILMALGQSFFALSLGQGTMITYGSYLDKKENLPTTCFPIALFGTFVSILAGVAIFSIVFSYGMRPDSGQGLMFETLPVIFSGMRFGNLLAIAFFVLIFLAALTSEISAMEPLIAYLIDEKKWSRHKASIACATGAFLLGIPCALSFGLWKGFTVGGYNFFDMLSLLCVNWLIPLGGLCAVLVVGWKYGWRESFNELKLGTGNYFSRYKLFPAYFQFSIRFTAPLIIVLILLNIVGII